MPIRPRNWRNSLPIIVPQAHSIAGVAIIRSLGRAGYPVHAVSSDPDAIGLHSRYAFRAAVSPPAIGAEFLPWLRHYVREHGIAAIEPGGMLEVLRPCFEEFRPLLPVSPDARLVYANLTKFDVFH